MNHFFVYTLVFSPFIALSQTIEVKPVFISDTISLLEPWYFHMSVKNTSDSVAMTCGISNKYSEFYFGNISMQIREDTSNLWKDPNLFQIRNWEAKVGPNKAHPLLPGENRGSDEIIIPSPFLFTNLDISTSYFVRILYNPLYCEPIHNEKIVYDSIKLILLNPSYEDSLLFNHLQSLEERDFYCFPLLYLGADTAMINETEIMLHAFPNATIAPYFHLYLCHGYYNMARYNIKDIPKCLDYLRNARDHGLEAIKSNIPIIISRAEFLLEIFAYFVSYDVFSTFNEEGGNAAYPEFLYKREKR
ncbi:MAG: hypothetical protein SFV22_08750 [Saprospiraceae bacterium]|nr:hypothetical protein [Saprospiraceae bacterium]